MTTVIQRADRITRARALSIRSLTVNGEVPITNPNRVWIQGAKDIPVQYLIEAGERVIDKADGVGVIAIHEEDDTLIGADFDINLGRIDPYALSLIVGGTVETDGNKNITGWIPPTITQRRDNPKYFELDIYSELDTGGFLRSRFLYCKGQQRSLGLTMGPATMSVQVKARPNPVTGLVHELAYVAEIPNS